MTTEAQRKKARRLVKSLHSQGNSRQAIINAVAESCGMSLRYASNIVSRSGLYEPLYHNKNIYGQQEETKAAAAWAAISINIDTGTHPYYIAARILDAKPGISAEVRDGVCYRNGHPWPAMKFLAEAGVELG
jgi:hypothetical protein